MAVKLFCLVALLAVVVNAENDCNCEPLSELENTGLWEFFKKLSNEPDQPDLDSSSNKDVRAVLPGELSPLLQCNCLENNRKKRRIMPESAEEAREADIESLQSLDELRTPKCPRGFIWYGIMCVNEKYVGDK